jgi:hypothetical protein
VSHPVGCLSRRCRLLRITRERYTNGTLPRPPLSFLRAGRCRKASVLKIGRSSSRRGTIGSESRGGKSWPDWPRQRQPSTCPWSQQAPRTLSRFVFQLFSCFLFGPWHFGLARLLRLAGRLLAPPPSRWAPGPTLPPWATSGAAPAARGRAGRCAAAAAAGCRRQAGRGTPATATGSPCTTSPPAPPPPDRISSWAIPPSGGGARRPTPGCATPSAAAAASCWGRVASRPAAGPGRSRPAARGTPGAVRR